MAFAIASDGRCVGPRSFPCRSLAAWFTGVACPDPDPPIDDAIRSREILWSRHEHRPHRADTPPRRAPLEPEASAQPPHRAAAIPHTQPERVWSGRDDPARRTTPCEDGALHGNCLCGLCPRPERDAKSRCARDRPARITEVVTVTALHAPASRRYNLRRSGDPAPMPATTRPTIGEASSALSIDHTPCRRQEILIPWPRVPCIRRSRCARQPAACSIKERMWQQFDPAEAGRRTWRFAPCPIAEPDPAPKERETVHVPRESSYLSSKPTRRRHV